MSYAVGIVGATGLVGRKIAEILDERGFPVDRRRSRLFASMNSFLARKQVRWGDGPPKRITYAATADDFEGLDFVFLSAGGDATKTRVSKELVPLVAEAGAIAIDNSSAFRMDFGVPLVCPEVNPCALDGHSQVIANPNCTTLIAAPALRVLRDVGGLATVRAVTYQSTSGQGAEGIDELVSQTTEVLDGVDRPVGRVFPSPVAFNVVPLCGTFNEDGATTEEAKFKRELRKIFNVPSLPVHATCVRAPVVNGHSLSLSVGLRGDFDMYDIYAAFDAAPGIQLADVPQPRDAAGQDDILVGRIQRDPTTPNGISLFVSGDNLRKGAALNAVQIAELLISEEKND